MAAGFFSSAPSAARFVVFLGAAFFAGAFFAADFLAAGFFSSVPEAASAFAVDAAFLVRVVFCARAFTSGASSVVAESFAEARDALTRVPFIDGYAKQRRLQIGIPSPV